MTDALATGAIFLALVLATQIGTRRHALSRTMTLRRDPATGRRYTRAGLAYLAIWLVVLLVRVGFIAALEHSRSFAESFGALLFHLDGSSAGVSAFFLLMALAMVITRESAILIRSRSRLAVS